MPAASQASQEVARTSGFVQMNLRVFHCGISYSTHNPLTGVREQTHVSGFVLAQDKEHCEKIAKEYWTRGKIEWCDENTWQQTQDTGQKWLNVQL